MNPLLIARNLRTEYLRLLKTTFNPRQEDLKQSFHAEIERDGFLTREPFVALAQPYKVAPALTELLPETRQRFAPICDTPYEHQAAATKRIIGGQPTVVATGTGSGKTEAFLMPIVDHCLRTHQPGVHSVKAILIYPMNALANDQNNRIRERLAGTDISYGRYTRETKMWGSRPADVPQNERVIRTEFRAAPPDLLLTNYMMLEYMLMRGDGREIFRNHNVRFIVLDEVHTYHGLLGSDVACLLRRLREALTKANPSVQPLFIGTSATLQAGEDDDPRTGVADFFTRLTGQSTPPEAVITEVTDPPVMPVDAVLPPPPEFTEEELAEFSASNAQHVARFVSKLYGSSIAGGQLSEIWSKMALPYLLMDWLRQPRSEEDIIDRLAERPERAGLDRGALRREIEAALLVGPCIDSSSAVKLRPRVHRFLRGLARFWRCTNPECGKLVGEEIDECDECHCRTLPLALCRTCGWDFFMAEEGRDGMLQPWLGRRSDKSTIFLYDPPATAFEVDEEDAPLGDDEEDDTDSANGDDDQPSQPDAQHYLDPASLRLVEPQSIGRDYPVHPVNVHHSRGTRCPICRSRYGAQDVLTPVSLGNSSALTHISRVIMRDLPESHRKLLVFCDSRQDTAHQARFIGASEDRARIRRLTYQALAGETEPHDLDWLVDELYEHCIEEGVYKRSKKKDEQRRRKKEITGDLLGEFAIAARVRAGLERLGLVRVRYAELDADMRSDKFVGLCVQHGLQPELARQSVIALLDFFRHRMALSHEILKTRLFSNDKLASDYRITVNRQVGIPVAFVEPGQSSRSSKGYKLTATWNAKGNPAGPQKLWRQFHGDSQTEESFQDFFDWLATERDGASYLTYETIGSKDDQGAGWQVDFDMLEFEVGKAFLRCSICDRVESNSTPSLPCSRSGCHGKMIPWAGPITEENLNALMVVQRYAPPLYPAEHSAAVPDEERERIERGFMDSEPPRPNLLACTPTLEMGVNIGDLEAVAMRNIPPSPANYAQRSGRTGRVSRMGITAGFSRNTPHDGYFFDHPDEIIAGAIPPPKINLRNLEAIARHVRSLILELAELDFKPNLELYLTDEGGIVDGPIEEIVDKVKVVADSATTTALKLWGDIDLVTESFTKRIAEQFASEIRTTIVERGNLISSAVKEMQRLGMLVNATYQDKQSHEGYRQLAVRLRVDNKYAYLPRVLAEAGLLPGYSFPGDPGSVSLGYDPEPIFGGRLQAQREFAPGQIIYARSGRWRVGGVALHRPGASASSGQRTFDFTLCGSCGLANGPKLDFCARCNHQIGDSNGNGLKTFTAWDAGAFQAWDAEVAAESEEERAIQSYDVRPHPQRDVDGVRYQVGLWQLELREQEDIWFVNHGLKDVRKMEQERGESPGFPLCSVCGEYFNPSDFVKKKSKKSDDDEKDSRSHVDSHSKRCTGKIKSNPGYALGHQLRADTLRLVVPNISAYGDEAVKWAWSFVYATIQGAVRLFEIDPEDIEAYVLTKVRQDEDGKTHQEVLDILWIDRIVGGSGVLHRLALSFPKVANAALDHLAGHDCPNSCYRCLRSYRNQWWHKMLDWRLIVPYLRGVTGERVERIENVQIPPPNTEGPEWAEARAEGCESPQELNLLKAIRLNGSLPEPKRQLEVYDQGKLLTRADFAYTDCEPKLLIYVDGLAFHSEVRQRVHDNRITNRLQMLNYRVLRFLGAETHCTPEECVKQIVQARQKHGSAS